MNVQEGDIVLYTASDGLQDTARVRRVYSNGDLQLVNHERGYQLVELDQVREKVGETVSVHYYPRVDCAVTAH